LRINENEKKKKKKVDFSFFLFPLHLLAVQVRFFSQGTSRWGELKAVVGCVYVGAQLAAGSRGLMAANFLAWSARAAELLFFSPAPSP